MKSLTVTGLDLWPEQNDTYKHTDRLTYALYIWADFPFSYYLVTTITPNT